MSKKNKLKIEEKKRLEHSKRKRMLCFGLFVGLFSGFCLGYCMRKFVSSDAQKRITEKAFYRDRLGEIKYALNRIKKHAHFDGLEDEDCYYCEDLIESELNA